MSTVKLRPVAT